jgi:superkiller protein 3
MKELAGERERQRDHTPVLFRLAQLERESGQLDDAIAHLRLAVRHEPGNAEARLELGRALYDKGDIPAAISETQKILEINPKQVDALYNMGAIYANLGDAPKARSYWTAAVAAAPNTESGSKASDGLRQLGEGGMAPKG